MQVLYISRPPSRSAGHTSARILLCLDAHSLTTSGLHCSCAPASLRNIPSPLHGTSATIMSKKPPSDAKAAGSTPVTTTLGSPQRATLSSSTRSLSFMTSLLTRRKLSPKRSRSEAAMSVVLPPGAAQRSSTLTPGPKFPSSFLSRCPTYIAELSCT